MLVLTRLHGETVFIGEDITIKVLQLSRRAVKLGIEAPREIPVSRVDLNREEEVPASGPELTS
ncbi:carbon storage regulator [Thalassoroseus pseudoceratinae]|uniref:carbon storage regulator n=1 Tax=Thalassoroseus pseudoceratinae TaxID=2713176 RepID=UPI00141E7903|nr:carbon storage regulator [Thalassoroseus pseudoceratinae]